MSVMFRVERRRDGLCPRCAERPRAGSIGYCKPCRADYMREWRRARRKG